VSSSFPFLLSPLSYHSTNQCRHDYAKDGIVAETLSFSLFFSISIWVRATPRVSIKGQAGSVGSDFRFFPSLSFSPSFVLPKFGALFRQNQELFAKTLISSSLLPPLLPPLPPLAEKQHRISPKWRETDGLPPLSFPPFFPLFGEASIRVNRFKTGLSER